MAEATLIIGLGYGDEAKGSWTDHSVRRTKARYVVRFNGGVQAAHSVVTTEGLEHTFKQFGSGSLVPGTFTCLSRYMLIELEALVAEAADLQRKGVLDPLSLVIASENAPLISPFNRLINRIQEAYRGESRHGSCGFGVGLTQADVASLGEHALYLRDVRNPDHLRAKLQWLGERKLSFAQRYLNEDTEAMLESLARVDIDYYVDTFSVIAKQIRLVTDAEFAELLRKNDTVFEGAQGVLLDQDFGFFPHCTYSRCDFRNAEKLLREAGFSGQVHRVGLLRGYMTRHGAGPFITEDPELILPACHNGSNPWQGAFRLGWFDAVAARYALAVVGGVDTLAITNLDRMQDLGEIKIATRYENADPRFFDANRILSAPSDLRSLETRTNSMRNIQPHYRTLPGFGKREADLKAYLAVLATELEHPIHAYSATATCQKRYL